MDKTNRVKHNLVLFHQNEWGIEPSFAYQLQKELWEMEEYANKLADGLPCLPADIGNLKQANLDLVTENEELKSLLTNFLDILNIKEMSDNGRAFSPNHISSCRCMDMEKMSKILTRIEEIIEYQRPPKVEDLCQN